MSKLLDAILQPDNIDKAWRKLSRDQTQWQPGLSRADMQVHSTKHLLQLMDDVRNRRYHASPMRRFSIAKANGKKRVITAYCLRDKLLQRACLQVLTPMIEPQLHHASFAYRPGRNVQTAVDSAKEYINNGLTWLVDADILSFFDHIPHSLLLKQCKHWIKDDAVIQLFKQWLAQGSPYHSLFGTRKGIPQGAVISPLLCNIYLDQLDRSLDKHNLPFVRFADDFMVFTRKQQQAEKALKIVEKTLGKLKLQLQMEKTQICQSHPKVMFLGQKMPKTG